MTRLALAAQTQDAPPSWGATDSVAARFEDLLELRSRAAARGYHDLYELYTDRIVAEVLSCPDGLSGPGGHAA